VVALRAHRRLRRADHGRPCRRQRRSGRGRLVRPVKVLSIGSGPIRIGQAAEFDYAGTQACRAVREEGVETVLVNSNPATIMTDPGVADVTYLEPLTVEVLERVIAKERPGGLLATLGGQTGLNLAVALAEAGVLERYGTRLLGTPLSAIQQAEDREAFKQLLLSIGEPVPESRTVTAVESAVALAGEIGYPLVVRPAFTLGGTGGGMAHDEAELRERERRGRGPPRSRAGRRSRGAGALLRHRGEPARVALVGARLEGHRLSDRARGGEDRDRQAPRRDPQRGDEEDVGGLRARSRLRR